MDCWSQTERACDLWSADPQYGEQVRLSAGRRSPSKRRWRKAFARASSQTPNVRHEGRAEAGRSPLEHVPSMEGLGRILSEAPYARQARGRTTHTPLTA